jgi:hypothetical protein
MLIDSFHGRGMAMPTRSGLSPMNWLRGFSLVGFNESASFD